MSVPMVALLFDEGKLLREYWHNGHIGNTEGRLLVKDFNGDGSPEILLGGISHAADQATIILLDPLEFNGAAGETDPRFQLQGFAPGKELASRITYLRRPSW